MARACRRLADRVRKPFKVFSVVVFIGLRRRGPGRQLGELHRVHRPGRLRGPDPQRPGALALGYELGPRCRASINRDARAVSIEVGIQNSALGLVLIFDFFEGLGGMAIIAAWWGIWHIIAGLTAGVFWSRRALAGQPEGAAA